MRHGHKLRIARATDQLAAIAAMYENGLGLERLGQFEDHDGFDGVMLGHPEQAWHLEFTHHRSHRVARVDAPDNLLVFYVPDAAEHAQVRQQMLASGFVEVLAYNPYWDRDGVTLQDLDGYRVVLQNSDWPQ